ncbi:MAG: hypothetical protein JW990_13750, partial [Thermoleophilia bacterium]|nr:hypothetical protein [Thermoleophilia bacterium]
WGVWIIVMIAVFGYFQGTFHSYYTVVLAPAVAALAGSGCVTLWRLGRGQRTLAWVFPLVVAGSAVWSALLLRRVSGYAPGLGAAVIILGVVGASLLSALLVRRGHDRQAERPAEQPAGRFAGSALTLAATAVCAVALLAGPIAYDISTIQRVINGDSASAGPVANKYLGSSTDDLSVDEGLVAYLRVHREGAKYLVAVQTTAASVPLILATGEPVVTIGGYKSRDPYPALARLQSMVAAGELHYVLIKDDGSSASLADAKDGASVSVEAVLTSVTQWVTQQGTAVAASEYDGSSIDGTLYRLP